MAAHLSEGGPDLNRLKFLFAGLIFLSAASPGIDAQGAKPEGTPASGVHEIQVTLKKYEFDPGTLRVRKGEKVRLTLFALDHDHGFRLAFDVDQKVPKGTTTVVEFTADKAGTFQFRCSTVCGFGHRNMKGTLVVED
jgi:cytochrome c oxidase subunit 2